MQLTDESSVINRESASLAANYAEVSANKEKLAEVKNNIALAQSKASNDSLLYQLQINLWNANIGSKTELEQRKPVYDNSMSSLESAKLRYQDLLKELEFNARQARNKLSLSKYQESDYTIKSEMDGKVYSLLKEQGEILTPQTPLAVIGDAAIFLLEMQIGEYDIAKLAGMKSTKISGGEKNRVAIARALINDPHIIMGDEPSGNLDVKNSEMVFDIFKRLTTEFNQTLLVVTHDNSYAEKTGRISEMEDGRIIRK